MSVDKLCLMCDASAPRGFLGPTVRLSGESLRRLPGWIYAFHPHILREIITLCEGVGALEEEQGITIDCRVDTCQ